MNKEVVFVSGASRGIGTAIAESFAQLGHTVIGTSRSEFKFENKQDNLIPLALDISDRSSINNCVEYLKDNNFCLLYTSPSPRDRSLSRMPSSA